MNYKDILKVDVAFWIEYIVRALVPMIAFLATCGLYALDYGLKARTAFDKWHINWTQTEEPETYDYSLSK